MMQNDPLRQSFPKNQKCPLKVTQDMRQHLSDVRSARESIVTAYTNIMCVDVPLMTETYQENLDEQLERAITFERDLKNGITRYEMEMAKRAKSDSGSSQPGFYSPSYQFDTPGT